MSKKTMKQRIAVVAVSALTAGLFSVIAAPAAKAAQGTVGDSGLIFVDGSVCVATNAAGGAPTSADASADTTPFESGSALGKIITVPVGGSLKVAYDASDKITMSGPLSVTNLTSQGGAVTLNATVTTTNGKTIINGNAADSDVTIAALAVGTGVLTVDTTNADPTATAANTIYINIVAACTNTAFSATNSFITTNSSGVTGAAAATNVDANTSVTAGGNLFIIINAKNAYAATLNTGTYAASATNGALLSWGARGTLQAAGVVSSAILTPPTGDDQLRVTPASTALGATTTVTITHNGTTVATKNLTFFAEAASIEIGDVYSGTVGTTGAASTGYFKYRYKSAAGAVVPSSASALVAASQTAIVPAMTQGKAPGSSAAAVTGIAADQVTDIGTTTDGVLGYDCARVGTSTVTIATVNTVTGATITSPVTVSCTTGIDTYTVSTDKATYRVGEVATITITAKDSGARNVSDATDMTSGVVSVGGGTLTKAVAVKDLFRNGTISYRAQMTTAGAFNTVVTLPGTTKSVTAAYTVTDGGVSNAEVLKSIVALIASINKQIAALQKLILARK